MQKEEGDDFDPHEHRQNHSPTTDMETLFHLLKAVIGTGILAMSEAFKYAGMINGIISTALICFFCTYCLHVLVRSQYVICKRLRVGLLTYPESMKAACEIGPTCLRRFAPCASGITNLFLVLYQIGACCVYIVFVSINVKAVGDQYIKPEISLTYYILIFFIPFLLIMMVKNLKILSPFTIAADFITLLTFGVFGYYVYQDLPPFSSLPAFGSLFEYPLYFGTCLFSVQACGVIMSLENNMEKPKSFLKPFSVLNIGMTIVTMFHIGLPMMGYWRYGDDIKSSITLNFPSTDILSQVIRILYSTAIYISYSLQGYPAVQIVHNDYVLPNLKSTATETTKLLYEYMLRLILVILTFALSIFVPLLGLVISLVGAFCMSVLGIVFPAILEMSALWPDHLGTYRWILFKDIIIITIGIIGLGSGSYCSIRAIVIALYNG